MHARVVEAVRIVAGFVLLWLILDRTAAFLGSLRGEHGLAVCLIVLAAAAALAFLFWRARPVAALLGLGLKVPAGRAMAAAAAATVLLLAFYPAWSLATGEPVALLSGWHLLVPGLLAQGGIAEEVVFRGWLYGKLRRGRSFWRAAGLAAVPFAAVHLLLFLTLDAAVAAASLGLAVAISFPLAWIYDRAGGSIWPCALLHAVIQGSLKLVVVPEAAFPGMAMGWIALAAVAPWLLFLLRPSRPA